MEWFHSGWMLLRECSRDGSSSAVYTSPAVPPENRGDSPVPLWCRGNTFEEEVEPPELPAKPSAGSPVLPCTSQISAFPDREVSSAWPRDIYSLVQGQGWAARRQLSLQGWFPLGATRHCILLPAPAPRPTCPRWIHPGGRDAERQCCKRGRTTWSRSWQPFLWFSLPVSELSPKACLLELPRQLSYHRPYVFLWALCFTWAFAMEGTVVTAELSGPDIQDGAWGPSEAPGVRSPAARLPQALGGRPKLQRFGPLLRLLTPLLLPELAQRASKRSLKKREQ